MVEVDKFGFFFEQGIDKALVDKFEFFFERAGFVSSCYTVLFALAHVVLFGLWVCS